MKISVAAIVMPLSRQGFVNEKKLFTPYLPPLLVKNCLVELYKSIQELKSNNDSYWWYAFSCVARRQRVVPGEWRDWKNRWNSIQEAKSKMAVQLMSRFSLHHKNLKETKDGIWRMMTRTMKTMKVCKAWESECSSDSDVDEVLLMNRSCHLAAG